MRVLVCIDKEQNTILQQKILNETSNITYSIIDNPPTIEEKEGYTGKYALDENGEVYVEYTKIPLSKEEELQEQINELQDVVMTLANAIYS